MLKLRLDTGYVKKPIDYQLTESTDSQWDAITDNVPDNNFTERIKQEISLHKYALKQDLDILYAKRKLQKKQQKKEKIKRKRNMNTPITYGPKSQTTIAEEDRLDSYVERTASVLLELLGTSVDAFNIHLLADTIIPTQQLITPAWWIHTETKEMSKNDMNVNSLPVPTLNTLVNDSNDAEEHKVPKKDETQHDDLISKTVNPQLPRNVSTDAHTPQSMDSEKQENDIPRSNATNDTPSITAGRFAQQLSSSSDQQSNNSSPTQSPNTTGSEQRSSTTNTSTPSVIRSILPISHSKEDVALISNDTEPPNDTTIEQGTTPKLSSQLPQENSSDQHKTVSALSEYSSNSNTTTGKSASPDMIKHTPTKLSTQPQNRKAKNTKAQKASSNDQITNYFSADKTKTSTHAIPQVVPPPTEVATPDKNTEPKLTKSEQRKIMKFFNLVYTKVPGDGHCLWIAIMLGHYNCKLQDYPTLNDTEEANLFELKRSILSYLTDNIDKGVHNIHNPLLDHLQQAAPTRKFTTTEKSKYILEYMQKISSSASHDFLDQRYWGSAGILETISAILQKNIYFVHFNNPFGLKGLEKYDYKDPTKPARIKTIDSDQWNHELSNITDEDIILGFENGNHFYAYRRVAPRTKPTTKPATKQSDVHQIRKRVGPQDVTYITEESSQDESSDLQKDSDHTTTTSGQSPPPSVPNTGNSSAVGPEVNARREDTGEITDWDDLEGFSDLEEDIRKMAIEEYRDLSKNDLTQYEKEHQISRFQATIDLIEVCKKSATKRWKQQQEDQGIYSDSSATICTQSSVDSSYQQITPTKPQPTDTTQSKTTTATPHKLSPESKLLQQPALAKLMSPASSMVKAINATKLLEEAHKTAQSAQHHHKNKLNFPTGILTKPSFHIYQKWAVTHPVALLHLSQKASFPLLFLRQLSQKAVHELGQHLLNTHIVEYLENLAQKSTVKRQTQHIAGWLASIIIIKLPTAINAILTKDTFWIKLIQLYPEAEQEWNVFKQKPIINYLAVINAVLPQLFARVRHNIDYTEQTKEELDSTIAAAWATYDQNDILFSAIQQLLKHDFFFFFFFFLFINQSDNYSQT